MTHDYTTNTAKRILKEIQEHSALTPLTDQVEANMFDIQGNQYVLDLARKLERENGALRKALSQALRYIEVNTAYQGAMTAAEVEKAIKERLPSAISIGANSCNTLATFDFDKARAALNQ